MTTTALTTAKSLDTATKGWVEQIRHAEGPWEEGSLTSLALIDLRARVTDAYLDDHVMPLMGSALGFLTDRDKAKGKPPYDKATIRDVVVEAMLYGVRATRNEMNIIGGRCYVTRAGYERLVAEIEGLTELDVNVGIPIQKPGGAVVEVVVSWKLHGKGYRIERSLAIKTDSYTGADAIKGKARRKALEECYRRVMGSRALVAVGGEVDDSNGGGPAPDSVVEEPGVQGLLDRIDPDKRGATVHEGIDAKD